jgi:hypothetical protein
MYIYYKDYNAAFMLLIGVWDTLYIEVVVDG